ncbi:hypothetical protein [Mycobacterium sp. 29Ha]|uniref:hypothetical protein n=1 Tax=Mycobacterium sp. 29Ha TaxID=2939268 RepID=UPI0029390069|nr:hypothetical protein [Mycobacterium sp. 29Ha]MDV3132226.1 hypothetical protein [Mycobacterium sp. 29Ha]
MNVTIPSKLRLLTPAVMVAAIALGYPSLAGAAPSDPSGGGGWDQQYYDWCMAWAGFESERLKCCIDAGGSNVATGSERGDTVCAAPGGAGPVPPGGGAGPAPAATAPPPPPPGDVVPRPTATPPTERATETPPTPRLPVAPQPSGNATVAPPPAAPPTTSTFAPPPLR